jgi:CcmD family protein
VTTAASNLNFIIAAYTVSWIVILGYLGRLVRKGGRAGAEYERMAREHSGERIK